MQKGSLTIEGINFEAKKGEVTTIIGPVGSGKVSGLDKVCIYNILTMAL